MKSQYKYISFSDRKTIEKMYAKGDSPRDIAAIIGCHIATLYIELQRGRNGKLDANQRPAYSASIAQRTVQESFRRRGRKPFDSDGKHIRASKKS